MYLHCHTLLTMFLSIRNRILANVLAGMTSVIAEVSQHHAFLKKPFGILLLFTV